MRICNVEGCDRKHQALGLCMMHWKRLSKTGTTDARQPVAKERCLHCEREAMARNLCAKHWKQWRLNGDPLYADKRRAARQPVVNRGYVFDNSRTPEHRVVTGAKPYEVVHHINGIRQDNSLDNLVVLPNQSAHRKVHASLEAIAMELVREGQILFDRESGVYVRRES